MGISTLVGSVFPHRIPPFDAVLHCLMQGVRGNGGNGRWRGEDPPSQMQDTTRSPLQYLATQEFALTRPNDQAALIQPLTQRAGGDRDAVARRTCHALRGPVRRLWV
jgi:hypothetical protein